MKYRSAYEKGIIDLMQYGRYLRMVVFNGEFDIEPTARFNNSIQNKGAEI